MSGLGPVSTPTGDAEADLAHIKAWYAPFKGKNGLRQSDLPEVGSQGVMSEVLAGKRRLNARQVKALAQRFKVAAEVLLA